MPAREAMPGWWRQRRFGVLIDANMASVPGWAPRGEHATHYLRHLGGGDGTALAEVLDHHLQRWAHVERYDEFAGLLRFDDFDAEDWARNIADAGAGYALITANHADGWAWWEAPGTALNSTVTGPHCDVVAAVAAACERNDLVFGAACALELWPGASTGDDSESATRQRCAETAAELVRRYTPAIVHGFGHESPRSNDATTTSDDLLLATRLAALDPELVLSGPATWPVSVLHRPPDAPIIDGPWELHHPLGSGSGFNRLDDEGSCLDANELVALYTEVLAKGGNFVLGIGATADGELAPLHRAVLGDAGPWIREHAALLQHTQPWEHWGDDHTRLLQRLPSDPAGAGTHGSDAVHLVAVDLAGRGRIVGVDRSAWTVVAAELVTANGTVPVEFHHHGAIIDVDFAGTMRHTWEHAVHAVVVNVTLLAVETPVGLFESATAVASPQPLAPLVANAEPGDVVQLGAGAYTGDATVPPGVVLRGLGNDRTIIDGSVTAERGARIEHLRATAPTAASALALVGDGAAVLGCIIDGAISIAASECTVRATTARCVTARAARNLTVSRCTLHGDGTSTAVVVRGGDGHVVDSCDLRDHLVGVSFTATTGAVVRGNTVAARMCAVELHGTERSHVHGNRITGSMRAVAVDGGHAVIVDGNAVEQCDSGCLVQHGASACIVSGNFWEHCRVGLLTWDSVDLVDVDNTCVGIVAGSERVDIRVN